MTTEKPANVTLQQLTKEMLTMQAVIEREELDEEEFRTALDQLEGSIDEKCRNGGAVYRNKQAQAEGLKAVAQIHLAEYRRIMRMAEVETNGAERLRCYLEREMMALGLKQVEASTYKLQIKKVAATSNIYNEEALPEYYRRYTWTPNKNLILSDLKEGADIAGAELITNRTKLYITSIGNKEVENAEPDNK